MVKWHTRPDNSGLVNTAQKNLRVSQNTVTLSSFTNTSSHFYSPLQGCLGIPELSWTHFWTEACLVLQPSSCLRFPSASSTEVYFWPQQILLGSFKAGGKKPSSRWEPFWLGWDEISQQFHLTFHWCQKFWILSKVFDSTYFENYLFVFVVHFLKDDLFSYVCYRLWSLCISIHNNHLLEV